MSEVRTLPTPISLSDFDVGVTLGTGSFGRVRFATHKVRQTEVSTVVNNEAVFNLVMVLYPSTVYKVILGH